MATATEILTWINQRFELVLPLPHAQLYQGVVFGARVAWEPSLRHLFEVMGIQHIFSASGFNISVVSQLVKRIIAQKVSPSLEASWILAVAGLYTWLLGFPPSLVRALGMLAYSLLARLFLRRQSRPLAALIITTLALLAACPALVSSVSYQFSAAATLGIVLFSPLMNHAGGLVFTTEQSSRVVPDAILQPQRRLTSLVRSIFVDGLLLSVSAQLLTVPLSMYYFEQVATLSLLANLCLFWLIPILFIIGSIGGVLLMIYYFLGLPSHLVVIISAGLYAPAEFFFELLRPFQAREATLLSAHIDFWQFAIWCAAVMVVYSWWQGRVRFRPNYLTINAI